LCGSIVGIGVAPLDNKEGEFFIQKFFNANIFKPYGLEVRLSLQELCLP
jgi:hypothetical protein